MVFCFDNESLLIYKEKEITSLISLKEKFTQIKGMVSINYINEKSKIKLND